MTTSGTLMKDLTICLIESIQSTIAVFKNANVLVDDRKRIRFAILNLEGTLEPFKLKCMLQEDLTQNLSICIQLDHAVSK